MNIIISLISFHDKGKVEMINLFRIDEKTRLNIVLYAIGLGSFTT